MVYKTVKKRADGSFTVEAALIMPVILGVIVLFISLSMFFFDRCTIEHTVRMACINAVYADGEVTAGEYISARLPEELLLAWDINTTTDSDEDTLTVTVEASTGLFNRIFIHRSSALKHFSPKY